MQKTSLKKMLSCVLCTVLIAASALITTGCTNSNSNEEPSSAASVSETTAAENTDAAAVSEADQNVTLIGEGQTKFTFTVTDADGNESVFEISTDKTNVGEVLLEHGLIEGDNSEYGLFVKKVNGITADFDADGTYWAFYIDGEYAMTGVDSTEITPGSAYAFKVEK